MDDLCQPVCSAAASGELCALPPCSPVLWTTTWVVRPPATLFEVNGDVMCMRVCPVHEYWLDGCGGIWEEDHRGRVR
jgi:hypothetical protein